MDKLSFDKEPAVIVSTITAAIVAVLGLLAAFGLSISDSTRDAILGAVAPLVAVILLLGPVIRQMVYSPHTTQAIAEKAAATGDATIPGPPAG